MEAMIARLQPGGDLTWEETGEKIGWPVGLRDHTLIRLAEHPEVEGVYVMEEILGVDPPDPFDHLPPRWQETLRREYARLSEKVPLWTEKYEEALKGNGRQTYVRQPSLALNYLRKYQQQARRYNVLAEEFNAPLIDVPPPGEEI